MIIRQFYTSCLAQASYFIESDGFAAVIDPLRDIEMYLELATELKAKIRYVFVTHFHADFISGQVELAQKTGAKIIFGPNAHADYEVINANDNQIFQLGKVALQLLHTPGHTIESSCILLFDETKNPTALFSGDTLFIGDAGGPDLLSENLDARTLAGMLYDSIDQKIKQLPDNVILYPGHGAGSACGKNIGKETSSFIGIQKVMNPAFLMNREQFVGFITTDQPLAPAYFSKDASINKQGSKNLDEVISQSLKPLKPKIFGEIISRGAQILDTRTVHKLNHQLVKNALHIGLDGQFAIWAGSVINFEKPLLLVCDPGTEKEAIVRLARIGFDKCAGYLAGGTESWAANGGETTDIQILNAENLKVAINHSDSVLLDVRRRPELEEKGAIESAFNIPLEELKKKMTLLNKQQSFVIFCAGGYRSLIATSMMKSAGFNSVYSVQGGIAAIKAKYPEWMSA